MKQQDVKIEVLEFDELKILHILSKPPRIEAKIVFERDNISQKLIFTLMDISHTHGFGCSPPMFNGPDDPSMVFLIGTVLPTKRSLNKYVVKLRNCLEEVKDFYDSFSKQLDFSKLDVTMFGEVDLHEFFPQELAAVRDQHYNGSWEDFHNAMVEQGKTEEAEVVTKCVAFEEANDKDLGLIGHKLGYMLIMLEERLGVSFEIN